MGRSPCCAKQGMNRGAWSANEDKILSDFIRNHGEGGWRTLPMKAGLNRCGKSCRLRWLNYLRPDIKRGNISPDEEDLIIRLHKLLGNRWSLIAGRLPGRTDNEIKNYWNTYLGKKVQAGKNIRNTRKEAPAAEKTQKKTNIVVANKKSSAAAAAAAPALVAVVRTKAVKCTRPIITNPANSITNFNQIDHNYGPSSSSSMINAINKDSTNLQGGSSGVSNFSDFLMDSDIFGLFDFGQHDCGSKIDNINNNNIAGDHHDQNILQPPVIFPEEMLQNFCGAAVDSSVADPLESTNLDTFTSLLDFGLILETINERDETNYMYN